VAKCKTLLMIAQKAKNAKDDAKEETVVLQAESEKDKKGLKEKISTLESKIGDTEDVVMAKQRQLDRMSQENDLLLEQMNTYSSQLKCVSKDKSVTEETVKALKDALSASEKKVLKCMEFEANLICTKESEKQLTERLNIAEQELAPLKKDIKKLNVQLLFKCKELHEVINVKETDSDSTVDKDKIESLTKNLDILQGQHDTVLKELNKSDDGINNLKEELEACLTECRSSEKKTKESVRHAVSAKNELSKLEVKVKEEQEKIFSLEITIEGEKKKRELLETTKRKTDEQASVKLRDIQEDHVVLENEAEQLNLQVVKLEESFMKEQERADIAEETISSMQVKQQESQVESDLVRQEHATAELDKEKERISALEDSLIAKNQSLVLKDEELVMVSKEYENYKLRAQSVLKQSKENVSKEDLDKKQEDLLALEKMNDSLNVKMRSISLLNKSIVVERNVLKEEQDKLTTSYNLLLEKLTIKELHWKENIEEKVARIRQVENKKMSEVEQFQIMIDSLKQSHQQEVEMLISTNLLEASRLKHEVDGKKNEVMRLKLVIQNEQEDRRKTGEAAGKSRVVGAGFFKQLDISQVEREACDGQEVNAGNVNTKDNSMTSTHPLEQLLAQNNPPFTISEELHSTSSRQAGGVDRQVRHLASLLSESEAQNSRLEKLTEVLKEEIRTYQRSEERYKHIENLEYVKNVFLKFLTLSGAQERVRLIPVLKTILKLKKEEVDKIEELVRVEDSSQSGREGWGSYLRLWPSNT